MWSESALQFSYCHVISTTLKNSTGITESTFYMQRTHLWFAFGVALKHSPSPITVCLLWVPLTVAPWRGSLWARSSQSRRENLSCRPRSCAASLQGDSWRGSSSHPTASNLNTNWVKNVKDGQGLRTYLIYLGKKNLCLDRVNHSIRTQTRSASTWIWHKQRFVLFECNIEFYKDKHIDINVLVDVPK